MIKCLNLGCGTDIKKDCINIDIAQNEGVDLIHDLNRIPYPFEDNSIDYIIMNDIIEHLDKPADVLMECWRLLKEGGKCIIRVVYWNCFYTFCDPQHKHAFHESYFDYICGFRRPYYFPYHFREYNVSFHYTQKAKEKYGNDEVKLREKAFFHCNIIEGMEVTLIK